MEDWPELRCIQGASLRVRLAPGRAVLIGPSYSSQMCLPAAPAAGTVLWTGEEVTLEPEGPGFEVGGAAVDAKVRLGDGAEVRLGQYLLKLSWQGAEPAQGPAVAKAEERPRILANGQEVARIELRQGISIGSDATCDYQVGSASARRAYCVNVAQSPQGFQVEASGFEERGVLLNGQLFSRRDLVLGDYLQIGPLCFRYDGESGLLPCANSLGASLEAEAVGVSYDGGGKWTLDGATLRVPAGHFVGILGPSGSGKTTLLRAVSDLIKPGRGEILLDGRPLPSSATERRSLIGFVPQDDIVHLDLTVRQALRFGAKLRLPDSVPEHEITKLIERVVGRIFFQYRDRDFETTDAVRLEAMNARIAELLAKRVGNLSGGQRKRVSVAVELMSRPRILFLDEPTSGLDPASEQELMSMLRDVTNSGCSVVCTTHVLENVWRMHSFAVVHGGKVVFQGDSAEARTHFSVQDLSTIYQLLERSPGKWQATLPGPTKRTGEVAAVHSPAKSPLKQAFLLLHRQLELLKQDGGSIALLIGQPVLIGLALSLVSVDEGSIPYKLFFGMVIAFWFGCSNAAPQIVRERAILQRERGVGLGLTAYLGAKFAFFGLLTLLQVIALWTILAVPWYPKVGTYPAESGAAAWLTGQAWQAIGALAMIFCATAWGLAVSAWAKKTAQASFVVPLLVIPQILFSGFVFPLEDWQTKDSDVAREKIGKVVVRGAARLVPGYSGQRLMETSLAWDQDTDGKKHAARERAFDNLKVQVSETAWTDFVNGKEQGVTWRAMGPPGIAVLTLGLWTVFSMGGAAFFLRRERE
ncbi:ATP-binding cassette domain-containing protein [Haloferula sp. BvORR071]|uniref:ATP-binding cassette domain-containing protein n=1 Tax=Haloferula sp. BvORR071 TaxID=1396141 RepID=UPI000558EDFC|nr:ATP-binding cassette domain-containing protein [Haloferula sp. BvORR071]